MPEQVQKVLDRILEWWKKFNTKQKTLLISIVAVVLVALAILAGSRFQTENGNISYLRDDGRIGTGQEHSRLREYFL